MTENLRRLNATGRAGVKALANADMLEVRSGGLAAPGWNATVDLPDDWTEPVPPPPPPVEPEGEFFVLERPNPPDGSPRLAPRMMAHRTGFGWAVGGGNKDGALLPWERFCERHRIGQPGGATLHRLVPADQAGGES